MSASVTKYLPAIISWSSCLLTISLRNADTVIEPSGKANFAAISKRKGVVGVTVSGLGKLITNELPPIYGKMQRYVSPMSAGLDIEIVQFF
jgi:hypothetical protein